MDSRTDNKRTVSFELPDSTSIAPSTTEPYNHNDDYDFDPLSGSEFIDINPAPPPIKHRPYTIYKSYQDLNNTDKSYHTILSAKKSSDARATFFYKEIKQNSSLMPELESFNWGCYHLLTPRYTPSSTRAIYNRSDSYTGVSSKAISGFKSTKDDPLQKSDLQLECLNEGVTIEDMERLDQASLDDPNFDKRDDKDTLTELVLDDNHIVTISVRDLRRYRIARGLGCGLTASYLYKEDDLHRGNMSKKGDRIDFDGSNWPILSKFKASGYFDSFVRNRNAASRFKEHADDIRNFPNLYHASPYYWPTKPINTSNQLVQIVSNNPWSAEENAVYQKLSTHPVFNHFKYQTLLKFALTNADHYRAIAEAHIRPELHHENKSIIGMLVEDLHARIQSIKSILISMPEFADFMEKDGDIAFTRIRSEIVKSNQNYQNKIAKIEQMLLTLEKNNHQDIIAIAKKLNITHLNMTDHSIKEKIVRVLAAKKEAYLKLIIDVEKLTADFSALKNTVLDVKIQQAQREEQKLLIEQFQLQMQAQASVAAATVLSPKPSIK